MSPVYIVRLTRNEQLYDRLLTTEAAVVRELVSGEVDAATVHQIDCYDTDTRTAENVTEDIAIAVAKHFGKHPNDDVSPSVRDFIETHGGIEYARGLRVVDRTFAAA